MSCSMLHALHRMRSEVAAPGHLLNVALVSSSKVPLLLRFPSPASDQATYRGAQSVRPSALLGGAIDQRAIAREHPHDRPLPFISLQNEHSEPPST